MFLILFNYAMDWIVQQAPRAHLGTAISPEEPSLSWAVPGNTWSENTGGSRAPERIAGA